MRRTLEDDVGKRNRVAGSGVRYLSVYHGLSLEGNRDKEEQEKGCRRYDARKAVNNGMHGFFLITNTDFKQENPPPGCVRR